MQNNIGEARRSYSLKVGYEVTQDMAAEMFGVSPSGYKKWEQGVGKLNGKILCDLADKYECSVDYLLCRVDDPTPYLPVGTLPSVSKDEKLLIKAYRNCTPREKTLLVDMAETMADRGLAKNTDVESKERARAIGA